VGEILAEPGFGRFLSSQDDYTRRDAEKSVAAG
jgi:hypothetical protein